MSHTVRELYGFLEQALFVREVGGERVCIRKTGQIYPWLPQGGQCEFFSLFLNPDSGVAEALWSYLLSSLGSRCHSATLLLLFPPGPQYFMAAVFTHLFNLIVGFGWTLASYLVLDTKENARTLIYIGSFMQSPIVNNDLKKIKLLSVTILQCMNIISSSTLVFYNLAPSSWIGWIGGVVEGKGKNWVSKLSNFISIQYRFC